MRASIFFLWIDNGLRLIILMVMIVSWRFVLGLENINPIFFDEGLSHLFGEGNLIRSPDDRSVRLLLDKYTGNFLVFLNYDHIFLRRRLISNKFINIM